MAKPNLHLSKFTATPGMLTIGQKRTRINGQNHGTRRTHQHRRGEGQTPTLFVRAAQKKFCLIFCFCRDSSNIVDSDSDGPDIELWANNSLKRNVTEEGVDKNKKQTGISSSTLRLQISILQKIFEGIKDKIEDTPQVKITTLNELSKFASLLNSVGVHCNRDDPNYGANELTTTAWEKAIDFYRKLLQYPSPNYGILHCLKEKMHLYMYTAFPSDKTPSTVNEYREHRRKNFSNLGGRATEETFRFNPETGPIFSNDSSTGVEMNVSGDTGSVIEEDLDAHDEDGFLLEPRLDENLVLSEESFLTFGVAEKTAPKIDLDWEGLRNLAQPIVDMQLAKLAMNKSWKNTPIALSLGSLVVDNKSVCIESKERIGKLVVDAKMVCGRKGSVPIGQVGLKKCAGEGDLEVSDGHATRTGKKYGRKRLPDRKAEAGIETEQKKVKSMPIKEVRCSECGEKPCIWTIHEYNMRDIILGNYGYLTKDAQPPNSIKRMVIYREFVSLMNMKGIGKGVLDRLPKCIEDGVHKLYPNPDFMGNEKSEANGDITVIP
jgi:hypothetical protein